MERYPESTKVSVDDFRNCGWRELLGKARREDYSSMWQALSEGARQAIEDGAVTQGKVLWLLADACSMILKPESLNEPFAPFMVMEGKRSALPQDFTEDDIKLFAEIVPEIDHPKICARVSDLTWLLSKPRDPKYALSAIDNYRKIPINADSWLSDGRECWDRAIQICLMLRAGAGKRLEGIETAIVDSLKSSSFADGYLARWLSDLLVKNGLGGREQVAISRKLEELALQFDGTGDLQQSRDYFDAAAYWYKRSEDPEKATDMIVRNAEGWAKEAVSRQSSPKPSHMVAASFYEKAIQKYRSIPKALRGKHAVDKRIEELRREMSDAGKQSLDEMRVISSGEMDISKLAEGCAKAVRGKTAQAALLQLANIYPGADVSSIRKHCKEMRQDHPLQSLFTTTHMASDGRVVAKEPGGDLNGRNDEAALWPDMVKHYAMVLGLVVRGYIWPALEAMRLEHRLRELDFYLVVAQSPIIPPHRERLVAKALYSGYDNDFVDALHLLVPQVEHFVRYHLKQNEVKTTNLDSNGIENENGLSALMENSETSEIFGSDLAFELKALLCDPFGPNLRNKSAHGLVGYEESQNVYSVYAWWLMLHVVFNAFWSATQRHQELDTEDPEQDNSA